MQDDIDAFHAPPPEINDDISEEDRKEAAPDEFGNIVLGAPQPKLMFEDVENRAQEFGMERQVEGAFINFHKRFTFF